MAGRRFVYAGVTALLAWRSGQEAWAAGSRPGVAGWHLGAMAARAAGEKQPALLEVDFQQGMKGGWQFFSGSWGAAPEPDNYSNRALRAKGNGIIECGKMTWKDYTLSLRFRIAADDLLGIEVRLGVRRCAKGVYLLDVCEEGIRLYRQQGVDYHPLGPTVPMAVESGRWYHCTIECRGNKLGARIEDVDDPERAADASATDPALSSGRVQLGVCVIGTSAEVYFDDVRVTAGPAARASEAGLGNPE